MQDIQLSIETMKKFEAHPTVGGALLDCIIHEPKSWVERAEITYVPTLKSEALQEEEENEMWRDNL